MAKATGTANARAILDFLIDAGPRVAFFQALALIERALPERPQLGHDGPARNEPVRLRPSLSLACPPADIESITSTPRGLLVDLTFLGLYGVDSPLPYDYSEHLVQINDDLAQARVRSFIDIFHHRLYSLLYRAWRKCRPVAASSAGHVDPLHDRVLAFLGYSEALGLGLFQKGPDGPRRPRLWEARLRVLSARTAVGMEKLLRRRVSPPALVEQLESRWTPVSRPQRSRLGVQQSILGQSLLVGARVRDRNKLRLIFAARDLAEFEALLPEGAARREVDDAVAGYLRDPLDHVLEVTLPADQVPPWHIGRRGILGRNVWLGPPRSCARVRWEAWARGPGKQPDVES